MSVAEIASRLRVSTNAVYVWRRQWRAGGSAALASKGPGGSACRLDERRQDRLAQALEQGPAAHGFGEDQRWTLARVAELIARLFHTRYTLRGVSYLLHRMGFSPQVPAHQRGRTRRGSDRHLAAGDVAGGKTVAAERGAWLCFEDEAGQTLRPPKARTWGRRGRTPEVLVSGKGLGRVSVAGLVCVCGLAGGRG